MRFSVSDMCQTALLAAFIAVSGSFKIPSLIPGSEFQLSAPVAVAACGIFGIKNTLRQVSRLLPSALFSARKMFLMC